MWTLENYGNLKARQEAVLESRVGVLLMLREGGLTDLADDVEHIKLGQCEMKGVYISECH